MSDDAVADREVLANALREIISAFAGFDQHKHDSDKYFEMVARQAKAALDATHLSASLNRDQ